MAEADTETTNVIILVVNQGPSETLLKGQPLKAEMLTGRGSDAGGSAGLRGADITLLQSEGDGYKARSRKKRTKGTNERTAFLVTERYFWFHLDTKLLYSRLTGKGEGEGGRHAANVVGSGNRTRDGRIEDWGPPNMGRADLYATGARPPFGRNHHENWLKDAVCADFSPSTAVRLYKFGTTSALKSDRDGSDLGRRDMGGDSKRQGSMQKELISEKQMKTSQLCLLISLNNRLSDLTSIRMSFSDSVHSKRNKLCLLCRVSMATTQAVVERKSNLVQIRDNRLLKDSVGFNVDRKEGEERGEDMQQGSPGLGVEPAASASRTKASKRDNRPYRSDRLQTVLADRKKEGAKAVTRTQPLFAFGIAMETETLYIESLGCSHSPAAYHSVRMFEANGAQFRSCNLFQRRARTKEIGSGKYARLRQQEETGRATSRVTSSLTVGAWPAGYASGETACHFLGENGTGSQREREREVTSFPVCLTLLVMMNLSFLVHSIRDLTQPRRKNRYLNKTVKIGMLIKINEYGEVERAMSPSEKEKGKEQAADIKVKFSADEAVSDNKTLRRNKATYNWTSLGRVFSFTATRKSDKSSGEASGHPQSFSFSSVLQCVLVLNSNCCFPTLCVTSQDMTQGGSREELEEGLELSAALALGRQLFPSSSAGGGDSENIQILRLKARVNKATLQTKDSRCIPLIGSSGAPTETLLSQTLPQHQKDQWILTSGPKSFITVPNKRKRRQKDDADTISICSSDFKKWKDSQKDDGDSISICSFDFKPSEIRQSVNPVLLLLQLQLRVTESTGMSSHALIGFNTSASRPRSNCLGVESSAMVAYDELGSLVPIKRTLQVTDCQNQANKESEKYWTFSGVFAGTPTTADCVSTTARADRADLFHSCPHHPEPQWLQCFPHSLSQGKTPLGLSQEKIQQAASALNQNEHTTMRNSEDS
ncbi:hypothetical protein CCH79_00016089 [Gambusia affinis]|uniref:Uncharacterized protein n=1 Tax=Gambusia affinis TaxID=33528 RepID=A0A315V9I2_GAMAF|nr:hypothetical protein CCH79_00016089 [Gambusia affinis]